MLDCDGVDSSTCEAQGYESLGEDVGCGKGDGVRWWGEKLLDDLEDYF